MPAETGMHPYKELERMKMKKLIAMLMAGALCLGLMTACGGNKAPAESQQPVQSQQPETPALPTMEEGKLVMSTNAEFPPYESTDDAGNFVGIDIEIAQAIADKLGLELVIDDMDFTAALEAVQKGKSDITMAGITVNEERLAVMDFSDSYSTGIQVVIVKEGSEVTIDNMGDYLIGTAAGYTGNIYCTDDYGEDHVVGYDSGITAVQALLNGQVDCVVIDNAPAQEFVKANAGLTILDTEYVTEDYAIGMAKNSPLKDAVNGALAELIADGTVATIVGKYISAE